jgi:Pentapeptide repeats (8 copies)
VTPWPSNKSAGKVLDTCKIRLGGIYALERIARDSPRDQPTVVEVLSAFIRTPTCLAWTDLAEVNLSGANLARANLHKANLSGADLSGANLDFAILIRAGSPARQGAGWFLSATAATSHRYCSWIT